MSNREEYVSGTIKVGWRISEKHLGIAGIERELTGQEIRDLCDRIELAVGDTVGQVVDLFLDGEDKPAVRVYLEVDCTSDIEIDEGPVNGLLEDIRQDAEDLEP